VGVAPAQRGHEPGGPALVRGAAGGGIRDDFIINDVFESR